MRFREIDVIDVRKGTAATKWSAPMLSERGASIRAKRCPRRRVGALLRSNWRGDRFAKAESQMLRDSPGARCGGEAHDGARRAHVR